MAVSNLIEYVKDFDGSTEQFFSHLLAVQCFLAPADEAVILRTSQTNRCDILSLYPLPQKQANAPAWLTSLINCVRKGIPTDSSTMITLTEIDDLQGQSNQGSIIIVPFKLVDMNPIFAAFLIKTEEKHQLKAAQERLELTARLVSLSEGREIFQKPYDAVNRLQKALEIISAINRQHKFASVAMALCNEIASQWQCERVSLGLLEGRYIKLKALSHTEHFSRKMEMAQDIESVMEECLDQDIEILYPASQDATYISRAAEKLSRRYGPSSILSLPLRWEKKVLAVVTLERPTGQPFAFEEIETLRLTCELCTSRLIDQYEHGRWIGARLTAATRQALGTLVGPKHTWAKIAALSVFAAVLFLIFAKGEYRVDAPFLLEATRKQVVSAPFDGYLKSVNVEIGDGIDQGKTVLAEFDTAELLLSLAASKAEKISYAIEYDDAISKNFYTQAKLTQARIDKIDAQIDLLNYQIDQAKITSPLSGTVVTGDLKRQIGAPFKTGDLLFEIVPPESLRAELLVSEDQVLDIETGQEGYLAAASYPNLRIKFAVERIEPMAEVVNQRNVFKVRARLLASYSWMRPGMEGVAKVSAGKRRYIWIWTRKIANWIRMKLWL